MYVWETIDDLPADWRHGAIALGMFDGLHVGHQQVIRRAVTLAAAEGIPAVALTFRNHPLSVVAPERVPLYLETPKERREIMERFGVEGLVELSFTTDLAHMTPMAFLTWLAKTAAPAFLIVGSNYSFGDGGRGDGAYLREQEGRFGYRTEVCPMVAVDGETVSSTKIRDLLSQGDLAKVNRFLARPFAVSGIVRHGDARGRRLGFPTANIALSPARAMLANGAYAVRVRFTGRDRFGIANIGHHPTFGGEERRLEIHLLDFAGDLYDTLLKVEFIARLREEQTFPSAQVLQRQLCADEAAAREIFHLQ
ncbi:MAG: riboflavin biosynthesis protein RibF [Schwartzia sp. (in: firmicutes)]